MTRSSLGDFEQLVLLAILRLDENAYAPDIAALLETEAGRVVSRGALYSSLARLERKGLIRFRVEPGGADRGGYRKRRFRLTPTGIEALRAAHHAWQRLSAGLGGILEEAGS